MIIMDKSIMMPSSLLWPALLLMIFSSSCWMQTAHAMEASPLSRFEAMLYAKSFHITICLQDASSSELPDWVVEKPTMITSESTEKADEEYYVAMFTEIIFSSGEDGEANTSELCQAYLVENEEGGTGNIAGIFPHVKRLQSSRCVGLPLAGYDDAIHTISRKLNSEGRAIYRSELNGRFLYAEQPTKGLPIDLATTTTVDSFDTFHTHHSLFRNKTVVDIPVSTANTDDSTIIAGNSTNSTNTNTIADDMNQTNNITKGTTNATDDEANSQNTTNVSSNETISDRHPYYGYFMRIDFDHLIDLKVYPVQVSLGDVFQEMVNPQLDASKLDFCFSLEASFDKPKGGLLNAIYAEDMTPQELYSTLTEEEILTSMNLDESGYHKINLEDEVYDIMNKYANPIGAAGFEFPFMVRFRYATAVLDILYIFFVMAQRKMNGQYPSKRFDSFRWVMLTHVFTGMLVIYIGTYFHIDNEVKTVTIGEDRAMHRQILYYIMGAAGIGHTLTVTMALSKVMGERRITIPLYSIAAMINLTNGIKLVIDPTLQKCFLLWGSMNVFVYVRAICASLCFAYMDWELVYTFGITMAAFIGIPLTNQDVFWFISLGGIFVYAPFHDTICEKIGWAVEDHMNGNKPTRKNVTSTARKLRTKYIDEDFEKKLQRAKRQSFFDKAMNNMKKVKSFRISNKNARMSSNHKSESREKVSSHLEQSEVTERSDRFDASDKFLDRSGKSLDRSEKLSVPKKHNSDLFYPSSMILDSSEYGEDSSELAFSLDNYGPNRPPNMMTFAGSTRLKTVQSVEEVDEAEEDESDNENEGTPGGEGGEEGNDEDLEPQPSQGEKRRVYRSSIRKTILAF